MVSLAELTATQTVELTGHLFDSLILAKVIDEIQAKGGNFLIHNIQVGGF